MKLNNRGWGFRSMIVGISILFLCLFIVSVLISDEDNPIGELNRFETTYESLENNLRKASIEYQKEHYPNIEGELTVSLKTLVELDYVDAITDIETTNECSGYVLIEVDTYLPYIKCDNYQTNGYDNNLD